MKWKTPIAAILLLAMPLTSCAPSGAAKTSADFCVIAKPIYIGKADTLSDETARQVLDHDQTGAKLCGW